MSGKRNLRTALAIALSVALCAGGIAAGAEVQDTVVPASASDAVSSGEPQAQARLVGEFSGFAGSEANARSLVAGLRHGTEVTLAAPGTATRFTPPTRPMDFGNVRMALLLAREQLAQLDVARPTPAQVGAILAGGGIASRTNGRAATPYLHPGLLHMRAGGMSWAKIAAGMGVTLAQVMNDKARQADVAGAPDARQPAAAGGFVSVAGGRTDAPARRPGGVAPAAISAASITTSSAGAPRVVTVAKPVIFEGRPPRAGPERETRPSGGSVMAVADGAARAERLGPPVPDGAPGGAVRATAAAASAAADEHGAHGEGQATE
jgi:hypothetical protein